MNKKSVEERFWEKVDKNYDDGCWKWLGAKDSMGYGQMMINKRSTKAHRFSWELHQEKIPDGTHVLHKCDVRNCVRPDHLFLGTHQDNMRDMINKNRCPSRIKLTSNDVRLIRKAYFENNQRVVVLSKLFDVHRATIYAVLDGTNWGHVE